MTSITTHVMFIVNTDNEEMSVSTLEKREIGVKRMRLFGFIYDSYIIRVPKDDEYWKNNGIIKATSYFHTKRGKSWLLDLHQYVSQQYPQKDIYIPSKISEVDWV